ncbi:carboxylesterase/lipase family protein [Streptomyces sp. CA-111067]|uniref:carboxylesterase/lipase family protein n=1 Tax=Streptomyces sp. CA-111067 TaxID=3240046 RepID=UPI003D951CE7
MDEPVCVTRQGAVRGETTPDGGAVFRGIPYAAPPFGPNRFKSPQPHAGWDGVRDATAFGPTAPKAPYVPPYDVLLHETSVPGEDCLNLNVWTPGTSGRAPVMVWLHGGAFANGAGSLPGYDGAAFARDGVLCVTVNYRLGADGYLSLPDAPDNRGMLDQIAALGWVRDNIEAFGGDPGRVTVFGESAGAMSIGLLLTAPGAQGLFRRAILQSGATHHCLTPETARRIAGLFAARLGVEPTAAALSQLPLDELLAAQRALRADLLARPDPEQWGEAALDTMPFEPVAARGGTLPGPDLPVDLLVGTNSEEYRLFTVPAGVHEHIDEQRLRTTAGRYGLDPDTALPVYRAGRPEETPGDLLCAVIGDWCFRIPAIRLAEAAPRAWMYEFGWRSPAFDGRLGACHAAEIAFVFDTLGAEEESPLIGPEPPQPLAEAMHSAWVAFAATGDPGWAPYGERDRTTMLFGGSGAGGSGATGDPGKPRAVSDPRAEERALWEGVR